MVERVDWMVLRGTDCYANINKGMTLPWSFDFDYNAERYSISSSIRADLPYSPNRLIAVAEMLLHNSTDCV